MPKQSRPIWSSLSAIFSIFLGLSAPLFFPVFSQFLIIPIFISLLVLEYFRFKFLSIALYYQSMAVFKLLPWILFSISFISLISLDFYSAKSLSNNLFDNSNRKSTEFLEYEKREEDIAKYNKMCIETYSSRMMTKRLKCLAMAPKPINRPTDKGSDGVILFMIAFFVLSISLHIIALLPAFQKLKDIFSIHADDKKTLLEEHNKNIIERQALAKTIQLSTIELHGLRERSLLIPIIDNLEESKKRYINDKDKKIIDEKIDKNKIYYSMILNEGQPQPLTRAEFAEKSGLKSQALTRTYSAISKQLEEDGLIIRSIGRSHTRP